ncbi:MAG TPA: glycosyltransferase family 39 protein [Thermoanaerobaculia bacterium]
MRSEAETPRIGSGAGLALLIVAFGVRLAATAAVGFATPRFGDADRYLSAAAELARSGSYPDRTEPYFFRPPAYPLLLAAVTGGREDRVPAAKIANGVLGSLAALVLALLSARIFRRRDVALATGAVAAIHPSFVLLSTDVQSEPLYLVFFLLSGLLLLRAADRVSWPAALAAGALLALAALTRPSALALAPLLASPAVDRRLPGSARREIAAAALLGFVLALAPWTLRNARRYHEFIPVNDAAGVSLYAGNSSWTRSFYRLRSREEYAGWLEGFDRDLRARLASIEKDGELSPGRRSAAFARLALAEARENPAASLELLAHKAWQWVRPYPTPWYWPPAVVVGIGIYSLVLYAAAVRGFRRPTRRGVAAVSLAVLAIGMAAHVLLQVVWRYRVACWDPILILYGVFGIGRGALPR